MKNYILVSTGAAFGGAARYWLTSSLYTIFPLTFPYGTLSVNFIGSLVIGIVMFYFDSNKLISPEVRILLTTGFCGGLTTFSTFSYETVKLMQDAEYLLSATNVLANVVLTITAVMSAYFISKLIT